MKFSRFLVSFCILITLITGGLTGCAGDEGEALPVFSTGDKWVSRWVTGGEEYTVTSVITGEELCEGKDCYVMEVVFDPPYSGTLIGVTNKYEKATMSSVKMDYHSNVPDEITSITFERTGTPFYPLVVGKKIEEVEFKTINTGNSIIMQTQNVTAATTTVVEKMEKITVAAGTFECYKLLKYNEYGELVQITWRAGKTKMFQVKLTDMAEENAIYELVSYSLDNK